jgi:hypothetical protein
LHQALILLLADALLSLDTPLNARWADILMQSRAAMVALTRPFIGPDLGLLSTLRAVNVLRHRFLDGDGPWTAFVNSHDHTSI